MVVVHNLSRTNCAARKDDLKCTSLGERGSQNPRRWYAKGPRDAAMYDIATRYASSLRNHQKLIRDWQLRIDIINTRSRNAFVSVSLSERGFSSNQFRIDNIEAQSTAHEPTRIIYSTISAYTKDVTVTLLLVFFDEHGDRLIWKTYKQPG